MTNERLDEIENRALNPQISIINIGENKGVIKVYNQDSINDVIELISALQAERQNVAELQDTMKDLLGFTEENIVEIHRNSYSGYITGKCNWCKTSWEGFDNPKEFHTSNCVYNNLKQHCLKL